CVIQAISGLMSVTGTPESGPFKVGAPVIDYGTGVFAAFAVSAALFQREKSGKGQRIDVSMMDATLMLMSSTMVEYLNTGTEHGPIGNSNPYGNASYTIHRTRDGLLMLGAYLPHQRQRMWAALGRPDLAERAATMTIDQVPSVYEEEMQILGQTLSTKPTADWLAALHAKGVPAEPVLSVSQAATHEQVKHRGVFSTIRDVLGPGKDVTVPVSAFSYAH